MFEKQKFSLYDKVASKVTGFPGVGTIISVSCSDYFLQIQKQKAYKEWDEKFPGWKFRPVYILFFEQSRKPFTFEEFTDFYQDQNYNQEELKFYYERVPLVNMIAYVEDDLELFEGADKVLEQLTKDKPCI